MVPVSVASRPGVALAVLVITTLVSDAAAQAPQDRCAGLKEAQRANFRALNATSSAWDEAHSLFQFVDDADKIVGNDDVVVTNDLDTEEFKPPYMQRFATDHGIPELLPLAATGNKREFWSRAASALKGQMLRLEDEARQLSDDFSRLNCDQRTGNRASTPQQPTTGPLPIGRHGFGDPARAGQPIITDDLITRWLRAYSAEVQNGGAYWQAGRMTREEYGEVTERVSIFTKAACSRSGPVEEDCPVARFRTILEPAFTADELAVFDRRRTDLANALRGNWSQVRM